MTTITDHIVPGDEHVQIEVRAHCGASATKCHRYAMTYLSSDGLVHTQLISFQEGPIPTVGINGTTNEALLAIVMDRLRRFQAGPLGCPENGIAFHHLEEGLKWLKQRTLRRRALGIEGSTLEGEPAIPETFVASLGGENKPYESLPDEIKQAITEDTSK